MPWFKVDDKFHAHHKVRKAGKAAIGLWVLAGSYCMDNDTDGFIPTDVIKVWGCTKTDAAKLVEAGLWKNASQKGEDGYKFHDWTRFQPSAAVTAAKKAKEAEAGLRGNHKRWHADRGITDPDCEYCYRVPDGEPDASPDAESVGYPIGSSSGPGESGANRPVPVPDPEPHDSPNGESSSGRALELAARPDVDRLCKHLADRIAEDGSKRPPINKGWRDAARLMLDKDGRSEADVHTAIDWCQSHHFWRTNVLSMPTLREKYDRLRKVAMSEQSSTKPAKQQQVDDLFTRSLARGGDE